MKVLITGGSGGIGSAIVTEFRSYGHEVYAPSRIELNLAEPVKLQENNFDIVVNNAGINPLSPISQITDDVVMTVNYISPLQIIQQCLPYMTSNRYGRIVNVGSVWVEQTKHNRAAYSASKSALNSLSRSITAEYAKYNILANTVSPGFIDTALTHKNNSTEELARIEAMIPAGRLGMPVEIAKLIYSLTAENSYISGQNIIIDGGFSCVR